MLFFSFGGRDIADGLQDTPVIEPVHPCERGEFNGFYRFPRASVDELCLVEAVGGLSQRVIVGIANAADRRLDACLGKVVCIFDRDILAATVTMMNELTSTPWPALV